MRIRTNLRWAMIVSLALVPLVAPSPAQAGEWVRGDVILGVDNGQYQRYSNTGVFQETFGVGSGFTTGCAFDSEAAGQNLYTTYFSEGTVKKYSRTHPHDLLQTITTGFDAPESIVFAANGHFFVGHADAPNAEIVEYDAAGNQVDVDAVAAGDRGSDWIELSADQRTIFYTSEGFEVLRFDVVSDMQLTNFTENLETAFALRLLPPGDGTGGLLVADSSNIKRLDGAGNVVQTYDIDGNDTWFALNLDPNGTSFWSGDLGTGNFARFNISTGAVEVGPISSGAPTLAGICLLGEITAAQDTTRPTCRILSRTNDQVVVRVQDAQSGLREITISDPQNANVSVPPFTPGTTGPVDVTATKINSSQPARFRLLATDMQDNQTRCTSMGIIPF